MKKSLLALFLLACSSLLNAQAPAAAITSQTNVTCNGSCNGALTVTATGGTGGPYTYQWSNGATTATITNLCAGTYTAMVDDGVATATVSATVTQPAAMTISLNPSAFICQGNSASLCPATTGGAGSYTYNWAPFSGLNSTTTQCPVATPSVATSYTVTVVDANGCVATATTTVFVNMPPQITGFNVTEPSCGGSNGSVSPVASGTAPFTYVWTTSPPQTTQVVTNIALGGYTLTVTDAYGCTTAAVCTVADSCDLVWPGDANDDLVADNNDILAISLGNGTAVAARNATGNAWNGFPSLSMGTGILGTSDNKHIDCDGNGIINLNDTNAVVQNFSLTRPASKYGSFSSSVISAAPTLAIDIVQDTLTAGAAGNILLSLGDNANPANNVYGVAFTLGFDAAVIDPASFSINGSGSWLGTQHTDMLCIALSDGTSGMIQGVVSRYNHANAGGNGLIANLGFTTQNNYSGTQQVNFTLSNVMLIDNSGTPQAVSQANDSLVALDPLLGIHHQQSALLKLFPNPAREQVMISCSSGSLIELFNAQGNKVKEMRAAAGTHMLPANELAKGVYLVKVTDAYGKIHREKLVKE